jgi:two-component sensor histidine kinase
MSSISKKIHRRENAIIIVIWGIVLLTPVFLMQQNNNMNWTRLWGNWRAMLPFVALFLINHYLLIPRFLFREERKAYFSGVILLLLVLALGFQLNKPAPEQNQIPRERPMERLDNQPPPHLRPHRQGQNLPPHLRPPQNSPFKFPPLISSLLIAGLIIGFDTGLRMTFRWGIIQHDKAELEKENVSNQLAFLKNQLSPHFFMNTLNNIHALIDISTEEAKEAVIKLSHLMRHLLYESERNLISLKKEIDFIEAYIDLMRLRFSERVKIEFNWEQIDLESQVPPLLFTNLLENAFKHGISYEKDSYIFIHLKKEGKRLIFQIENSNHSKNSEDGASGIGVENTKQRLDLLYPENYSFEQIEKNEFFKITLNIPL